jgi:hypothetical protein
MTADRRHITAAQRQQAVAELERIERVLEELSAWIDGDGDQDVRAAIELEDAAVRVRSAVFLVERADPARVAAAWLEQGAGPVRVAELVHRRLPGWQG